MNSPKKSSDQITKDNQHQYYETAFSNDLDGDRKIRKAEARGREQRALEGARKQTIKRAFIGVLVVVVIAIAIFYLRSH